MLFFFIFFFCFYVFVFFFFFFFNDTATTEIYTLSLHDALPTSARPYRCTDASPAASPRASSSRVGASPCAQRASSRKNMPKSGPLVPPVPRKPRETQVSHSR